MKCSCLVHSVEWYEERVIDFLRSIFDPSIDDARRLISALGNNAKSGLRSDD